MASISLQLITKECLPNLYDLHSLKTHTDTSQFLFNQRSLELLQAALGAKRESLGVIGVLFNQVIT